MRPGALGLLRRPLRRRHRKHLPALHPPAGAVLFPTCPEDHADGGDSRRRHRGGVRLPDRDGKPPLHGPQGAGAAEEARRDADPVWQGPDGCATGLQRELRQSLRRRPAEKHALELRSGRHRLHHRGPDGRRQPRGLGGEQQEEAQHRRRLRRQALQPRLRQEDRQAHQERAQLPRLLARRSEQGDRRDPADEQGRRAELHPFLPRRPEDGRDGGLPHLRLPLRPLGGVTSQSFTSKGI
mmetsp:Transcript_111605/g.240601  ORF Transcript_111605/g.240601 Transcript_111605/m.240601 type:complete len:239 (+) Transcript_111605:366-1082(+)